MRLNSVIPRLRGYMGMWGGLLLWGAALCVQAAGLRTIEIPAESDGQGRAFKAAVWSPCAQAAQAIALGPFVLQGVRNCPLPPGVHPLVLVSHGHAASALSHHDTAQALADAGFIVAALNHPGDTATDMHSSGDMAALQRRPADVRRLLDHLLRHPGLAAHIDAQRVGFFGFSRGGFTGLVLGGARPDFVQAGLPCPDASAPLCAQMRDPRFTPGPWVHDSRFKALVIADPLNAFPGPRSLRAVQAPVQLWWSQQGGDGVLPERVAALAEDLPVRPEVHQVEGATHFAFLAPCPPALAQAQPGICRDGPGFSRAAFHQTFNAQVLVFLRQHLAPH